MKKILLISALYTLSIGCEDNDNLNATINSTKEETPTNCIKEGGEVIPFFYDDFSSEGAEGSIYFSSDTVLEKVVFSFATSMAVTKIQYFFDDNTLDKYKEKVSYLNEYKTGYFKEDSLSFQGKRIFEYKEFDSKLFEKIMSTASEVNKCWK